MRGWWVSVALAACGQSTEAVLAGAVDGSFDAGLDAPADVGADVPLPPEDVSSDAALDAGSDAGVDASLPPGPELTCASPGVVPVAPGSWARLNSSSRRVPLSFGCGDSAACPNHFWRIELDARRRLRVRLEPGFDGVVGLYGSPCSEGAQLECHDDGTVGAEGWTGRYDAGEYFISVGGKGGDCMNDYVLSVALGAEFPTAGATTSAGPLGDGSHVFSALGDYIEHQISGAAPQLFQARFFFEVDRQGCAPLLQLSINDVVFGSTQVPDGSGPTNISESLDERTSGSTLRIRVESLTECESGGWSIAPDGEVLTYL